MKKSSFLSKMLRFGRIFAISIIITTCVNFLSLNAQLQLPEDFVAQQEKERVKEYANYFGEDIYHFRNRMMDDSATMDAESISHALQDMERQVAKKTAVVYIKSLPKQLEILVVTSRDKSIRKSISAANQYSFRKTVKHFTSEISKAPSQIKSTSYLASALQLYQWIVAPIEKDLKAQNIDTLLFCVGSELRSAALSALYDGKQFLVEKYSLAITHAFSLNRRGYHYVDIRKKKVLAMGSSQFEDLGPLPGVPLELSMITQSKGGEVFLNNKFTVDNLKAQRRSEAFQIVHLATHAVFRPKSISNSYIQFWNKKLPLNQLRQLQLDKPPIELLVLSSCTTAVGNKESELGFSGLAVAAGVKTVLGSFWDVSDLATLAFMTQYYKHLRTAPVKADAVRQAKIEMLKGQIQIKDGQLRGSALRTGMQLPSELSESGYIDLSHPYYWAPFTTIGSPW